jgi:hypothetical protein
MKDQYVADINDFRKYALLRRLSAMGKLRVGVCWMLTPDDSRTDGGKFRYTDCPKKWEQYDAPVFKCLKKCIDDNERKVSRIESSGILPNAIFHRTIFTDDSCKRRKYFADMQVKFQNTDLIFFDPDNGIEVASRKCGRKNSSKYVYWDELVDAYKDGKSLLIYQHFAREKREDFIHRRATEFHERLPASELFSFQTPHVVFILASQPEHVQHFEPNAAEIADIWGKQIKVKHFVSQTGISQATGAGAFS